NGYGRYDRSGKETGLGELVDGMSLRDLHSPLYVVVGDSLSQTAPAGAELRVPLYASFLTSGNAWGDSLTLSAQLYGWDALGQRHVYVQTTRHVPYHPWMTGPLEPLPVTMPAGPAVLVLAVRLEDGAGTVLHRNFCTFVVEGEPPTEVRLDDGRRARLVPIDPARFDSAAWSLKQWNVMDGLKVNGAGSGFFEYRVAWPAAVALADLDSAVFVAEVSSKQLFGKDRAGSGRIEGDFMRGRGTLDPSLNPNAYPMTDERLYPSAVTVRINGVVAGRAALADDPADHRGILSWHYQKHDRRLREAGSYGTLLRVAVPPLLPLEVVEAAVARVREGLDLAPHRHLALAGEHVAPILAIRSRRHRVLQVRVPDVAAELADGVLRLLLAGHEGVMRVPQQGDGGGRRLLEQREQRGRVGEIAV